MNNEEFWYIVQTNPNCEKKAAREMRRRGYGVHIPRTGVLRTHHRTKKPIMKRRPAMRGYVFLRFKGSANWYELRQCQGVKGVLYVDGHPFALHQDEILKIIRAQRAMAYDSKPVRQVRREMRNGGRGVERAVRSSELSGMQPGRYVTAPMSSAERLLARIEAITKKGTVRAIVVSDDGKDRLPVEFTDVDNLELVDVAGKAA